MFPSMDKYENESKIGGKFKSILTFDAKESSGQIWYNSLIVIFKTGWISFGVSSIKGSKIKFLKCSFECGTFNSFENII